jgi:hypothetical protein
MDCTLLEWRECVPLDGTFLFTLNFADYLVFIAQDELDLEFRCKCLYKVYTLKPLFKVCLGDKLFVP